MNRVGCEDKEPPEFTPAKAGAVQPRAQAMSHANDNPPFDPLAWRRKYMRVYMQKRRERERAAKEGGK
jgi:hypothetical protein